MKRIFVLLLWMHGIIMLVQVSACNLNRNPLSKLWFFTHSASANGGDTLLRPVNFLQLRPDGTYTRDFGKFQYGKWHQENQQLHLQGQDGKTETLHFRIDGNEMQLKMPDGSLAYFDSRPLPPADIAENPFAADNNRWRIAPVKKETDAEIRSRLINHCRFWEIYFNWALQGKYSSIDVRSTPTPIKIYGNGFGLKPLNELPEQWVHYFYDTADCRKANEQLVYAFKHHDIAWAHTDNKFKMFIGAFEQLQRFLK
jgi:hypothetical protein